jgi:hypothetical protein
MWCWKPLPALSFVCLVGTPLPAKNPDFEIQTAANALGRGLHFQSVSQLADLLRIVN